MFSLYFLINIFRTRKIWGNCTLNAPAVATDLLQIYSLCVRCMSDWVQKILKYSIYLSRVSSLLSKIFCSLSGSDNINFFAAKTQDGLSEHFVGFAGQSDEFYTLLCAMGQLKL